MDHLRKTIILHALDKRKVYIRSQPAALKMTQPGFIDQFIKWKRGEDIKPPKIENITITVVELETYFSKILLEDDKLKYIRQLLHKVSSENPLDKNIKK